MERIWAKQEQLPHTPKKKLSIEVANIDRVHINDMYIFEP